jgi:predicted SprT family Zn-dependent metalloprotease
MTDTMTRAAAERITRDLLTEHGLTDWRVAFNRAKRQLGSCNYKTRTITLSLFALAQRSHADSLNTITHEVAHALTRGHGHDRVWQLKHRALGGDGRRCVDAALNDDAAPWVAACGCREYHRYRAPLPGRGYRCPTCRAAVVFELNPMSHLAQRSAR